ncbi:MAG: O-antigen polymerase [Candidatus Paceibacterota bacterium]
MNPNFLEWLKDKVIDFNIFKLGNSAVLYYLLVFYFLPLAVLLGFSTNIIFVDYQIPWLALGYATIGLLALMLGYFIPLGGYLAKKTPNLFFGVWDFKKAKVVFWTTFFIGVAAKIIRVINGAYFDIINNLSPAFGKSAIYSVVGYLDWFWYIALAIAFINYYSLKKIGDNNHLIWKWLAFGVLFMEIVFSIPTCSKIVIIFPVLIYLLIKSYLCKINYKQIFAVMVMIVVILFPFGGICRNTATLKINGIIGAAGDISFFNTIGFLADSFFNRINQISVFSKVLNLPSDTAALYGSSFSNFLTTLGPPRFIWKDKPLSVNSTGNNLAHELGIVSPADSRTSISPTVVGDLYINFGVWGIFLGMFLIGVAFRFIYDYLIELTNKSSSGLMIYSIFWVQIISGMEGWIAPVLAGLIKFFIILFIIHLFLIKRNSIIK